MNDRLNDRLKAHFTLTRRALVTWLVDLTLYKTYLGLRKIVCFFFFSDSTHLLNISILQILEV